MAMTSVLRLVPAVTLLLSVATPPCACGVAVSEPGKSACCDASMGIVREMDHDPQSRGCCCCGQGENPSPSEEHSAGLCCSWCTDECEQPAAMSWDPATQIPKCEPDLYCAAALPPVAPILEFFAESAPAAGPSSAISLRPNYILNHLLRI